MFTAFAGEAIGTPARILTHTPAPILTARATVVYRIFQQTMLYSCNNKEKKKERNKQTRKKENQARK